MSDPARPASLGRKAVLAFGSLIFLHAAYSTYEYLSFQKSLGLVKKGVPSGIIAETFVGLFVVLLGTLLTASPLRDISWSSEYSKRTIDQIDCRPSFAALNHRGPIIFESVD